MAAPYYDNVQWPGGDGIRVPTEVFGSGGPGVPGGTLKVNKAVAHSYASGTADWTLTAAETAGSIYVTTLASGGANMKFPAYVPGKFFVLSNASGQTITCLVTGKTGIAVATAKAALLFMDSVSGDVQRVTADTTISS